MISVCYSQRVKTSREYVGGDQREVLGYVKARRPFNSEKIGWMTIKTGHFIMLKEPGVCPLLTFGKCAPLDVIRSDWHWWWLRR